MSFDEDIAMMPLSEVEKNGLQVFRNYQRAFEREAEKRFAKVIDSETLDLSGIAKIISLVETEESRVIPVIVSAYADDSLTEMFRRSLPNTVIGGRKEMMSGFGPLANYSSKIKLAHAFDMLSEDICLGLNDIRSIRNKISHSWDLEKVSEAVNNFPQIIPVEVEDLLSERADWFPAPLPPLSTEAKLKIRVIWLLARVYYEARYYAEAKKQKLSPLRALYGENRPQFLTKLSGFAITASSRIVRAQLERGKAG